MTRTAHEPTVCHDTAQGTVKPLGGKAYGSIGHFQCSRTGPGDWHIHFGQEAICTERPRSGDRVIVQEKLDGSCMAVARVNGAVFPLTRSGWPPEATTFEHLRDFSPWVSDREKIFRELLPNDGDRVCGEWLTMAHGTRYDCNHPGFAEFIPFDIFRGKARVLFDEFSERVTAVGLTHPHVLHDGESGFSVSEAERALGEHGFHGAIDPCEGAVWRVEREGRVDFLAKWVRSDKIDGKYFSQLTGMPPVWNLPKSVRP